MAAEPQFAGIFTMADQASIEGQRRQMRMLRFELGTVLVGAFLGAIDDDARASSRPWPSCSRS